MNKKNLRFVSLFAVVMVLVLGGILGYRHFNDEQTFRGQHTFAQVRDNLKSLDKIVLTTPKSGVITIYRKNDFWHFKEASDYFVNIETLSDLYAMVNNSVIISVQKATPEMLEKYQLLTQEENSDGQYQGTEVAVYDNEEVLLSDIILGKRVEDNEAYVYARRKGKPYVYVVSNIGRFSGENQAWIPYPLFQIDGQFINSIEWNGLKITRQQLKKKSPTAMHIKNIINSLSSLDYQGIVKKDDFFQNSQNAVPKEIQFNMNGGIIYKFRIYYVDDEYWLAVDVLADTIAYKDIKSLISENQKYFENWLFQLFYDDGELFYNE